MFVYQIYKVNILKFISVDLYLFFEHVFILVNLLLFCKTAYYEIYLIAKNASFKNCYIIDNQFVVLKLALQRPCRFRTSEW